MATELVEYVHTCEKAGMFEEMKARAFDHAAKAAELSLEERRLLAISFKAIVGPLRFSWNSLIDEEKKQEQLGNDRKRFLVFHEREQVEREILNLSAEMIGIVQRLNVSSGEAEGRVVFLKLLGDAQRYKADIYKYRGERELGAESVNLAREAYDEASVLCRKLDALNVTSLGLAVNFSKFTFEMLHRPREACLIAKEVYERAALVLGPNSDPPEPVASLVQTLRNNLLLWTTARVFLNCWFCHFISFSERCCLRRVSLYSEFRNGACREVTT